MKKLLLASVAAIALTGCAKNTSEIQTTYVSPMVYTDYSCKQLRAESARLSRRAQELTHSVNDNADGDAVAMGVGLVLFWPALFFIDGDNPDAQEFARIKGEYNAVEKAYIQKECGDLGANPFQEAERKYREQQERRNKESEYPSAR